jgi:hypothetical protein
MTTPSAAAALGHGPHRARIFQVSLLVLGTLALGFPRRVSAFKPETHAEITRRAAQRLDACLPQLSRSFDREALQQASEDEDDWTLERLRNWHFFDRERRLVNDWLFQRSATRVVQKRAAVLAELLAGARPGSPVDREQLSEAVGALLHFIQDMAVPSHVVPIYHVGDEPFDSYYDEHGRSLSTTPAPCSSLLDRAATLPRKGAALALYEQTARATWAALDQPAQDAPAWRTLWLADGQQLDSQVCLFGELQPLRREAQDRGSESRRGFGCYHPSLRFGEGTSAAKRTAHAFFSQQFQAAVDASAVLLIQVARTLEGAP